MRCLAYLINLFFNLSLAINQDPVRFSDRAFHHRNFRGRLSGIREVSVFVRDTHSSMKPGRLANATTLELDRARAVVAAAIKSVAKDNKARVAKPLCSRCILNPQTKLSKRANANEDAAPLFNVTDEVKAAASLVAETEAYKRVETDTAGVRKRQSSGDWWMGNMKHQGSWLWENNEVDYKVFRNVKDYGAKGNGKDVVSGQISLQVHERETD